jgi:2-oxoglutarate dehydrogenase complex dehydrogenase (E1) component-like enzyme
LTLINYNIIIISRNKILDGFWYSFSYNIKMITNFSVLFSLIYSSNYFHVLLILQRRKYRKLLIIPFFKEIIKTRGSVFIFERIWRRNRVKIKPLINAEITANTKNANNILICQGHVYYDLLTKRNSLEVIAIITLEQIEPVPYKIISENILLFSNAKLC